MQDLTPQMENPDQIKDLTFQQLRRTNRNWLNDLEARKILKTFGIDTI